MKNTSNQIKIVEKPWGHEEIWTDCSSYIGKIISIDPGKRLSRQYHVLKEETIMVLEGTLLVELGPSSSFESLYLQNNEVFHVKPGTIHRFCNQSEKSVRIVEVSTHHPEDVVRLEDDYNR